MIPTSEHILQAFKLHPDKPYISLKRLTDAVEGWRHNISVLDEVNDEEDEEDKASNASEDYVDYDDFENGNQN